jgi:hypothetical protein
MGYNTIYMGEPLQSNVRALIRNISERKHHSLCSVVLLSGNRIFVVVRENEPRTDFTHNLCNLLSETPSNT